MDYLKLKSGSDVRGVAIKTELSDITLTNDAVKDIVASFAYWLKNKCDNGIGKKTSLKIAVGHDSRLSSENIKETVINSLKQYDIDIYDSGLTSTPCMYMLTKFVETDCDGAIMITASHHPFDKNGLKFFTKDGGVTSADLENILKLANSKTVLANNKGAVLKKDFLELYCSHLIDFVTYSLDSDMPLKGLKIVVDAGNGAGGFYANRVLKPLGADITGSQFLEPDGNFPNHVPNPEDSNAMKSIRDCVVKNKADLGIIFDTDVDRAAIVTSDGREINRNKLIAMMSSILLAESPKAYIVTDSVTSTGLKNFITKKGGVHVRYKRGYSNVINKAKDLNRDGFNALLAIETSGHAALKENDFLDDGAYLVTRLLIKLAQLKRDHLTLNSLISDLEEPKETIEFRLTFKSSVRDFKVYGNAIIDELTKYVQDNLELETSNHEGVRANVDYADGWFLLRLSVHDPIMPLNIESNKIGGVEKIVKFLNSYLSSFDGLNCKVLADYLK